MDGSQLILLYIDAGSLGYMIQMGLAAAGGALVYGLMFWRRLTSKIILGRKNDEKSEQGESGTEHKE